MLPFSVEMRSSVPLASVKPIEWIENFRSSCIELTRQILRGSTTRRTHCLACVSRLEAEGDVDGLPYLRCPACGSLFFGVMPAPVIWKRLLGQVGQERQRTLDAQENLRASRNEYVYSSKLEWIRNSLRLDGKRQVRLLDVTTPPSRIAPLLEGSGAFADILVADEMTLAGGEALEETNRGGLASAIAPSESRPGAALLLESLDRVIDPGALLRGVHEVLDDGGLLFVTAAVSSGFDMSVLGVRNQYLYPPDRTNCFSLEGLQRLISQNGFELMEVSTPGALDLETVQVHAAADPSLPLTGFERSLVAAETETQRAFQAFLQQARLSSFARVVGRKQCGNPSRAACA